MICDFYKKAVARPEVSLILVLFLISSVAALQGASSSYTVNSKLDFGLTDNVTSSSFTGRIISGFEAVGTYFGNESAGRFGIMDDLTSAEFFTTVFINSTDGTNRTGQDLNCFTTLAEPHGGTLNVSVKWYKNDVEFLSENYYNSYANGSLFSSDLDYGNTTRGENWSCALRAFNGAVYSNWTLSSNLTITNTPPTITLDYPSNNSYVTNSTPAFNWTGTDPDGDSLTYDFNISLVPASLCTDSDQYVENLSTNNFTASTLSCYSDDGDYYVWSVRGKDNYSAGDWSYFNLNHAILVDLSFPTSTVNFGEIPYLGSDNTTDDSPAPFVIQNNGNTLVNVNISAEDLWEAVANPTEYYRLKVDNVSGEEGAFDWNISTTDWANAPADNNSLIIYKLNFSDTSDSAELDIFVQVPINETPSTKSSIVTFIGSYVE